MKLQIQALALLAAVAVCEKGGQLQDDTLIGGSPTDLVLAEVDLNVRQVAIENTMNSTMTSVSTAQSASEFTSQLSTALSSVDTSITTDVQTSTKVSTTERLTSSDNVVTSTGTSAEPEVSSSSFVFSESIDSTTDTDNANKDSSTFSTDIISTTSRTSTIATTRKAHTFSSSSVDTFISSIYRSEPTEAPETHIIETTETTVSTFQTTNAEGQTTFFEKTIDVTHTIVVTKSTGRPAGSLATADSSSGDSSGLSTKSRNIVIGVIVGVFGGLILLGALYMAWKLYKGRNSRGIPLNTEKEIDSILSDDTGHNSGGSGSGSRADPFRQNLDQYHSSNSSKPVINTAANF